jgi:hypothetical protein
MTSLPRQARDKHKETLKKGLSVFSQGAGLGIDVLMKEAYGHATGSCGDLVRQSNTFSLQVFG